METAECLFWRSFPFAAPGHSPARLPMPSNPGNADCPTAGTARRNASDFETWIAHALSVAPELPAAFAPHLPGTDGEDSRHCAVLMLPRERLDRITRAYTSH